MMTVSPNRPLPGATAKGAHLAQGFMRDRSEPFTMRALLIEGGGVRSAFAAGVLDALTDEVEPFDIVAGTSAGALLGAAFLAGQHGRSARVLRDPACRAAFGRIGDFLRGGDLVDLDLLYDAAEALEPLDAAALCAHPSRFFVTLTDVESGAGCLIEPEPDELVDALIATSALPIAVREPRRLRGRRWLDGGIALPIPVQQSIDLGATHIVIVRTRQAGYRNSGRSGRLAAPWFDRHQPALAEALRNRGDVYNAMLDLIEAPPAGISIEQILPRRAPACSRTGGTDVDVVRDHLMGMDAGRTWLTEQRLRGR